MNHVIPRIQLDNGETMERYQCTKERSSLLSKMNDFVITLNEKQIYKERQKD